MSKGPQGQKRPADVIGCAIAVAKIATGEVEGITGAIGQSTEWEGWWEGTSGQTDGEEAGYDCEEISRDKMGINYL